MLDNSLLSTRILPGSLTRIGNHPVRQILENPSRGAPEAKWKNRVRIVGPSAGRKGAISKNIAKYFEEVVSKENIAFAETFYGDEVEVFVNDLVVNGKEAYLARLNRIHKVLLKDMTVEKLHVHTNYFSPEALAWGGETFGEIRPDEPTIWTNAWAAVKATGRITNKEIEFRIHMDFRTSKDKVVEMLAYYDPTQLNAEIAALEASEAPEEEATE